MILCVSDWECIIAVRNTLKMLDIIYGKINLCVKVIIYWISYFFFFFLIQSMLNIFRSVFPALSAGCAN